MALLYLLHALALFTKRVHVKSQRFMGQIAIDEALLLRRTSDIPRTRVTEGKKRAEAARLRSSPRRVLSFIPLGTRRSRYGRLRLRATTA
jgi:hypothetical protein